MSLLAFNLVICDRNEAGGSGDSNEVHGASSGESELLTKQHHVIPYVICPVAIAPLATIPWCCVFVGSISNFHRSVKCLLSVTCPYQA
jgi:hypothetical protein